MKTLARFALVSILTAPTVFAEDPEAPKQDKSKVTVVRESTLHLNMPNGRAGEVVEAFANFLKVDVVFRDKKELSRELPFVTNLKMSREETVTILKWELLLEDLRLSKTPGKENQFEITREFDEKTVALNQQSNGVKREAPRYAKPESTLKGSAKKPRRVRFEALPLPGSRPNRNQDQEGDGLLMVEPNCPMAEFLETFADWLDVDFVFRDQAEIFREISFSTIETLSKKEALPIIKRILELEGLSLVKSKDKENEYVLERHLDDKACAALNQVHGRKWKAPDNPQPGGRPRVLLPSRSRSRNGNEIKPKPRRVRFEPVAK